MTLPNAVIGETYRSTFGWDLLTELEDLSDRMPGHDGERAAADLVADTFESLGLDDVTVDEFPIPAWHRGDTSLTVAHRERETTFSRSHELVALPGTPASEVRGKLVDLGDGLPEAFEERDLDGAVVMASTSTPDDYGRWVHRTEKYHHAAASGAVAFVFYNHLDGALPPTGKIGAVDGPGPIPAVGVSKEVGARLRRYCDARPTEVDLSIACTLGRGTSRNVEATVGPDTTDEVVFTAHLDSHDIGTGANDNGFGTAMVVEVGKMLTRIDDRLETKVRLVVFGAEEIGMHGSYYWSEKHDLDAVNCLVNVDGAGYSRNLEVHTHGFDGTGTVFAAVGEEFGVPIAIEDDIRPYSDQWPIVQHGVPGVQIRSSSGESGRGWGHTHGDTLDKCDIRDLRDLSILCAAGVVRLANDDTELPHVSAAEIRRACIDAELAVGLKITDSWPEGPPPNWLWRDGQVE